MEGKWLREDQFAGPDWATSFNGYAARQGVDLVAYDPLHTEKLHESALLASDIAKMLKARR